MDQAAGLNPLFAEIRWYGFAIWRPAAARRRGDR
jgi:hypothetical protein